MRSIFRHVAEELPDSATGVERARHLHGYRRSALPIR
jgi:hypothetical protein